MSQNSQTTVAASSEHSETSHAPGAPMDIQPFAMGGLLYTEVTDPPVVDPHYDLSATWVAIGQAYADLEDAHRADQKDQDTELAEPALFSATGHRWEAGGQFDYLNPALDSDKNRTDLDMCRATLDAWLTSAETQCKDLRYRRIVDLPSINVMTARVLRDYGGIPSEEGLTRYLAQVSQDPVLFPEERASRMTEIERLKEHLFWSSLCRPLTFDYEGQSANANVLGYMLPPPSTRPEPPAVITAQDSTTHQFVHLGKSGAGPDVRILLDEISRIHLAPLNPYEIDQLLKAQESFGTGGSLSHNELPRSPATTVASFLEDVVQKNSVKEHSHWMFRPIFHMIDGIPPSPEDAQPVDDSNMSDILGISLCGSEGKQKLHNTITTGFQEIGQDPVEAVSVAVSTHLEKLQEGYISLLEDEHKDEHEIQLAHRFLEDLRVVLRMPINTDSKAQTDDEDACSLRLKSHLGSQLDLQSLQQADENDSTDDRVYNWLQQL